MDPRAVAAIDSFCRAMNKLEQEYVHLLVKMGCKRITLHRF